MSLKVNPAKIHLGKDQNADAQTPADNQYHAEYLPSPTGENKPVECILPPETPVELNIPPLLNIDQTCVYQFPDIIPLPPTYNPPPFIPCACEKLEYTNDVTFTGAGEGTFLNIIAGGPNNCDSEDPAFCNVSLSGTINIPEACPEVTVDVDVTGKGASKTSSILGVPASDGCGIKITGEIETIACESFTSSGEVVIKGRKPRASSAPGASSAQDTQSLGKIFLTSVSTPECGVKIDGNVYIPCPDFTVSGSFTTVGQIVESNTLQISKAPDDCNIDITGQIVFKNPCDLLSSSSSTVPISGGAICSNTLKLVKNGCSLSWEGAIETCLPTIDINACQTLIVSPNPSKINIIGINPVTGQQFPTDQSDPQHAEWNPVANSSISFTASKSGTYGPCLLSLTGNTVIQACKKMEIEIEKDSSSTSTLNVTANNNNIGSATIGTLISIQQVHPCKKKLTYKTTVNTLDLSLCNLFSYTNNITDKTIKITNSSGTELASAVLKPAISITGTDCQKTISASIQDINLQLAAGAVGISGLGQSVNADYIDACAVTSDAITGIIEEDHRLRIEVNEDDKLELKGSLLTPCFTCAAPQEGELQKTCVYSDIELDELRVNDILPTQCCSDIYSENFINLCTGIVDFRGNGSYVYIGEAEGERYSRLDCNNLLISIATEQWVDLDLAGLNIKDDMRYLDFDFDKIKSYSGTDQYIDIDYDSFEIKFGAKNINITYDNLLLFNTASQFIDIDLTGLDIKDGTKLIQIDYANLTLYTDTTKIIDIDLAGLNILDGTKYLDFDFDKIKSYTSATKYIDIDYSGFNILDGAKYLDFDFDKIKSYTSATKYIDIDYSGFNILDGTKSLDFDFTGISSYTNATQYIDIDYDGFNIQSGVKSIELSFDNLTLKDSANNNRYIDLDFNGLDISLSATNYSQLNTTSLRLQDSTSQYGVFEYNGLYFQNSSTNYVDLDFAGLDIVGGAYNFSQLTTTSLKLQSSSSQYGLFESNGILIQGPSNYVDVDLDGVHVHSTGTAFGELTPTELKVSSGVTDYSVVYPAQIEVHGNGGFGSINQAGFASNHANASLILNGLVIDNRTAGWTKITVCTGTGANATTSEIYVLSKPA